MFLSQRLSTLHGEDWTEIPQKSLDIKTDDEQTDDIKPNVKVIKEEKSDELCIDERPRPVVKKAAKRKSNR